MYEVNEGRRTQVCLPRTNGFRKVTDSLRHKLIQSSKLRAELSHKIGARSKSIHIGKFPFHLHIPDTTMFHFHLYRNIAHQLSIIGRINNQYRITFYVSYLFAIGYVIVPNHHDIKTRHVACHVKRSIFLVFAANHHRLLSGVKQTNHNIRTLFIANHLHPLAGRLFHVVKPQSVPQVFGKPGRNSRSDESQYRYFYPRTFHNGIRRKIRFTVGSTNNVGTQHREIALVNPAVIHIVSGFHVVISHIAYIVTHVVHHVRTNMSRYGINVVIIIRRRLSLKNVSVIHKNQILTVVLAFLLHKSRHACHTTNPVFL